MHKINVENRTIKSFVLLETIYSNAIEAVSASGRYMASGRSVVDTDDCHYNLEVNHQVCKSRSYAALVDKTTGYEAVQWVNYDYWLSVRFSDDERSITLEPENPSNNASPSGKFYRVSIVPQLEYLALGDSFSSGEGDLGKRSNGGNCYREGTDVMGDRDKGIPRELCHISQRSYPYILASGMELSDAYTDNPGKWGSVACSGAVTSDIDESSSQAYSGQNDRLQGLSKDSLKNRALDEMIPGRQKQIEFVKKYRPKAVTITTGGNDVNFEKVILACVSPFAEWTSRCSYAKDNGKKANVAFAILDLKPQLVNLYKDLKNAGDNNMQLYVLGYPVFVDDKAGNMQCGLNVRLDKAEREMIAESTKFLNQIVRLAASEAGAVYINTENSLGNHKLCGSDGKKAVNGITGLWDNAESFHPNYYGHELMANTVWNATGDASLLSYTCKNNTYMSCPNSQHAELDIPDYFKKAITEQIRAKAMQGTIPDSIQKGLSIPLTVLDYTFGSNQVSFILLYSERTELGSFTTNNNGGYTGSIQIPDHIKPGYHTLEIESINQNGEPIKLWKIVEVRGEDPNDWDGDGVPNDVDQCLYLQPAGIDDDGDGVDDGCDPEISNPVERLKDAISVKADKSLAVIAPRNTGNIDSSHEDIIDWQATDKAASFLETKGDAGIGARHDTALQIAGTIALSAIVGLGITLWIKISRRKNEAKSG